MARIFCFGDSITYGESDTISGGWVERLKQAYLTEQKQKQKQNEKVKQIQQKTLVYNLGVASETTDGLEKRFVSELACRKSTKTNNITIISYGINDLTKIIDRFGQSKNRVPLGYFTSKLQSCVEFAQGKNIQVILTSILPFAAEDDGQENCYNEIRLAVDIDLYNKAINSVCIETGCIFIDLFAEFSQQPISQLLARDGLHPNEKGHRLIFVKVKDLLDTLIT